MHVFRPGLGRKSTSNSAYSRHARAESWQPNAGSGKKQTQMENARLTIGENIQDAHVVILLRARDATLERALHKKKGVAKAIVQTNVKGEFRSGYDPLCFIFSHGRRKFVIKAEHIGVAQKLVNAIYKRLLAMHVIGAYYLRPTTSTALLQTRHGR
jgi:hypothetical protein